MYRLFFFGYTASILYHTTHWRSRIYLNYSSFINILLASCAELRLSLLVIYFYLGGFYVFQVLWPWWGWVSWCSLKASKSSWGFFSRAFLSPVPGEDMLCSKASGLLMMSLTFLSLFLLSYFLFSIENFSCLGHIPWDLFTFYVVFFRSLLISHLTSWLLLY